MGEGMNRVLTAVCACVLFANACVSGEPTAEEQVQALMEVWRTGDVAVLDSILAPDVVYDDLPNSTQYEGRDEVRGYVDHVHGWAGAVTLDIVRVAGNDRDAVAEWVMRGVQDSPIPGRVPVATQRPFEIDGVTLVTLDDEGRISRAADYMDVLGFVLQLGSEVILPGGVRLGGSQP